MGDLPNPSPPQAEFNSNDNVITFRILDKEFIKLTEDAAYLYGEKIEDMGKLHSEFMEFFKLAKQEPLTIQKGE